MIIREYTCEICKTTCGEEDWRKRIIAFKREDNSGTGRGFRTCHPNDATTHICLSCWRSLRSILFAEIEAAAMIHCRRWMVTTGLIWRRGSFYKRKLENHNA